MDEFSLFEKKAKETKSTSFNGEWVKWNDYKGCVFIGTFDRVWERENKFQPGTMQKTLFLSDVRLKRENGTPEKFKDVGLKVMTTMQTALDEGKIKPGDRVGIAYLGDKPSKKGANYKDIHCYNLSAEAEEAKEPEVSPANIEAIPF